MAARVAGMIRFTRFFGGVGGRTHDAGKATQQCLRIGKIVIERRSVWIADGKRYLDQIIVVIGFLDDSQRIRLNLDYVVSVGQAGDVNPLAIERRVLNVTPTNRDSLLAPSLLGI